MTEAHNVEIVSDGDVVFVGTDHMVKKSIRMRVSSAIVCLHSPVFKTMLRPKFKEGNILAAQGYVEVPLPDDEPLAMTRVLAVLHAKNSKVPKAITREELQNIADIVDKYDCAQAVAQAAHLWLEHVVGASKQLLEIAYRLRQDDAFEAIGFDLIHKSYQALQNPESELAMVYYAMEAERQRAASKLTTRMVLMVAKHRSRVRDHSGVCDNDQCTLVEDFRECLMGLLEEHELIPILSVEDASRSLSQAIIDMQNTVSSVGPYSPGKISSSYDCGSCMYWAVKTLDELNTELDNEADSVVEEIPRLCLPCVRSGSGVFKGAQCTHEETGMFFSD